MKNNKALIPFIIASIGALGVIVTTTYDSSAPRVASQVVTTEISTTVSPATVPAQKQTNYSSTSSSTSKTNHSDSFQSDNDYGYGDPLPGESFVDYMKREDPDLYNSMKNDYESMFGDW